MPVIIVTFAMLLVAGMVVRAQAQTTVVPRTTITIDERPVVVQPAPLGPTPTPEQRRWRDTPVLQAPGGTTAPAAAAMPATARRQGPRRPTNGYSSFLTGPIDLTRPPVPQQ